MCQLFVDLSRRQTGLWSSFVCECASICSVHACVQISKLADTYTMYSIHTYIFIHGKLTVAGDLRRPASAEHSEREYLIC